MNESESVKKSDQPKRRACDECRARKLACSKEPDGCARCKREGIQCYYSPQKPMGRPRKRPHAETQEPSQQPVQQEQQQNKEQQDEQQQLQPMHAVQQPQLYSQSQDQFAMYLPPDTSTLGMDLDMSFLDVGGQDVNFLDLLGPEIGSSSAAPITTGDVVDKEAPFDQGTVWPLSSHIPNISFDSLAIPPTSEPNLTDQMTLDQIAQFISSPELSENSPDLSPQSSNSTDQHPTPPDLKETIPAVCSCLASLYLAMDSIQRLPKEVGTAMRVARTAAKTAHDTILCNVCGNPPFESPNPPPTNSFQVLMMLGGLLPSISSAYMRILAMVDDETSKADTERRKITFTLADYGGIWGQLAREDVKCGASAHLEGAVLEPQMWRRTVRALLKTDVYGINEKSSSFQRSCEITQPGLKDIIEMLEERSRSRHKQLDALVAAGAIKPTCSDLYVPLSQDRPTCLRIIDIAKKSIDNLIIP